MDPITTAIVATVTPGVPGSDRPATAEAYETLKTALSRKFGTESDLIQAIARLERKPDSAGRRQVLSEEVAAARADQYPDLLVIAQTLLNRVSRPQQPLPPPLQRPPRVEPFIGRVEELAQLTVCLEPGQVVALCGPGGIGKSALAAEAVWQLAPGNTAPKTFPDGIIYYSFRNRPRTDIALEQIARAFGEVPKPTPYDAAQRALSKRKALLVLDGIEQADDLSGILAARGDCGVLVTGRHCPDAIDEQQDVAPLPPEQAVTLLQHWGGWQAADVTATRQICELAGRLPLSVQLAGHYLATEEEKSAGYLAWLETTPLAGMSPTERRQESVPHLLAHSLAQVSQTARQILAVAGLLALVPFDQVMMAEALTIKVNQGPLSAIRGIFKKARQNEIPDVSQALGELVKFGLLRTVGERYQVSHLLIHTYARKHLELSAPAIRQLATYFVALAWEQTMLGPEGYAKLDANRPHLMRVLAECLEWEDWEAAYGLASAIEDYLDRQGYWAERVIANEIGLMAAWQLGRPSEGAWLGNLGDTYRAMGHAKWAIEHFEKALVTARQTGNRHSEGNSLGNLGLAYRDLGQNEQARVYLEQSLLIFERLKSPSADLVRDWLAELEVD